MKKSSNFLRSSKEKLTKSFNSAKCKTSLKLASSRLKLMRNKKEVQVKQMKRELAQLLESGQNQTARIRVEHVVREEKMMAAYDLLEIYCELIVARLPIIESQKNCPIDLKEAITSVVFASPRCGDIPELIDVRKHFKVKYGNEFITGAVELRPDCGVSRLLVEKLSAKAPDGQTKLKILTAIAEEQGVKWDPNSFGESDLPPSDLLNGPNTFEKASKVLEDPPRFESSEVRTPPTYSQAYNESSNVSEQKKGSPMTTPSFASQGGTSGTVLSYSSQVDRRHSGFRSEMNEVGQSFPENGNFSMGRQSWNMEFKDATSAAQAAAESAERASMAARAAAELSRMTGQYQTESKRSHVSIERDEQQAYSGASIRNAERRHHDFPDKSFTRRDSRLQDEVGSSEHDNMMKASRKFYHDDGDNGRSSGSQASPRSESSIDNDLLHSPREPDSSRETNLSKEEHSQAKEVSYKHTGEFEPQSMSDYEEDENYFGEERTTVEVNNVPRASHSSTSRYGDINHNQKPVYEAGNDLFANAEEEHVYQGNMKTSSYDVVSAVFDKSSSDDEDAVSFHTEPIYDDQQSKFYFPSPERKSPTHPSVTGDNWSPRMNTSKLPENSTLTSQIFVERYSPPESPKSLLEEASGEKPQAENFVHATFDDSDGMSSETEDIDQSELIRKRSQSHGSRSSETGGTESKKLSHSSNEKDSVDAYRKGDYANDESLLFSSIDGTNQLKSSHSRLSVADGAKDNAHLSHSTAALIDDEEKSTESNSDYANELNFGKLRGGLRHKGYITPPYTRAHQTSSFNKSEEVSATSSQSTASQSVLSSVHSGSMKKGSKSSSRMTTSHHDFDTDSSDEELPQQISSHRRKPDVMKLDKEVETKPRWSRGSVTYFDSTDSEVESPKQPNINRKHMVSQFSRRTKVSPPSSETNFSSQVQIKSETSGSSSLERKSSQNFPEARAQDVKKSIKNLSNEAQDTKKPTRKSYTAEAEEQQKDTRKSYDVGKQGIQSQHEQHSLGRPVSKSKTYLDEEKRKTPTTEQASQFDRKTQSSSNTQTPKASGSSGSTLAREESTKKPSHVHPKLPDYENIAAQLQSLRMNRK
ncbi:uncharacterized protein LOC116012603 isoform X1 [Ipomoea triloba]|uniref:uncharacterized protein LOC116012603 isoform X1 n=2 Tax=Ipomoea triloba TaxID=35885 RepID=UPI00125CFE41|nr:uncharacterized protein LOC116012603 isoform X1 [Ipomoea triloba]